MSNIPPPENSVNELLPRSRPKVTNFIYREKNSLKGIFDLQMPSGMSLHGLTLHESHGRWWVGLPAKSFTKADGTQSWARTVSFHDHDRANTFQVVVTALAREAMDYAREAVA